MLLSAAVLDPVLRDRRSGSRAIARTLVDIFATIPARRLVTSEEFAAVGRYVLAGVPAFALVHAFFHELGHSLFGYGTSLISGEQMGTVSRDWWSRLQQAAGAVSDRAARYVTTPATVLTISNSGAVLDSVTRLHQQGADLHVLCLESLPGSEGRVFAEEASRRGLVAETVKDARLGDHVGRATHVLVGADAVFGDVFWNKIGTGALLSVAAGRGLQRILVAETAKWVPDRWALELQPASVPEAGAVFEPVAMQQVTAVIAEQGTFPPSRIRALIHERPVFVPLLQRS